MTIKERLLNNRKIDETTGCWLWVGSIKNSGHAQISIKGKLEHIHRISYEIFIGPLKNDCLHKTICPNKHCFNPEHLYDGNQHKNTMDSIKTGTHFMAAKTYCKRGHEFTLENTHIHSLTENRECKICMKLNRKKRYDKKKLDRKKL